MYDNGWGFVTFFLTVAQWSLSAIELVGRVKTCSIFFLHQCRKTLKKDDCLLQIKLLSREAWSVHKILQRQQPLHFVARLTMQNSAFRVMNVKLAFQTDGQHRQVRTVCSAPLLWRPRGNTQTNLWRKRAAGTCSATAFKRKKIERKKEKREGGATCFCTAAELRRSGRAY